MKTAYYANIGGRRITGDKYSLEEAMNIIKGAYIEKIKFNKKGDVVKIDVLPTKVIMDVETYGTR
jgi:hypothetical protein